MSHKRKTRKTRTVRQTPARPPRPPKRSEYWQALADATDADEFAAAADRWELDRTMVELEAGGHDDRYYLDWLDYRDLREMVEARQVTAVTS